MTAQRVVRVHIKNNRASPDTFPTREGEEVFTITPGVLRRQRHYTRTLRNTRTRPIDWDIDHFAEQMRDAEVLVT